MNEIGNTNTWCDNKRPQVGFSIRANCYNYHFCICFHMKVMYLSRRLVLLDVNKVILTSVSMQASVVLVSWKHSSCIFHWDNEWDSHSSMRVLTPSSTAKFCCSFNMLCHVSAISPDNSDIVFLSESSENGEYSNFHWIRRHTIVDEFGLLVKKDIPPRNFAGSLLAWDL